MVRLACLIPLLNVCLGLNLKGKLLGMPEYQLDYKEKVVNGDNLSGRCSVKLTGQDDTIISTLVTSNFEFSFFDIPEGKYDLFVSCHDFMFTKDRYQIEVNDSSILATHYYLNKEELDEPIDVTEDLLTLVFGGLKQYYEIRQGSIQAMIMNSPLGFIFKNTTYTLMFVFCVVMMIGPTVLKMVSPEFARKLDEIQREARDPKQDDAKTLKDAYAGQPKKQKIQEVKQTASDSGMRKRK